MTNEIGAKEQKKNSLLVHSEACMSDYWKSGELDFTSLSTIVKIFYQGLCMYGEILFKFADVVTPSRFRFTDKTIQAKMCPVMVKELCYHFFLNETKS